MSTHHWWPSRPLCRIDVQLPWTVRLWVRTHLFGTVPSTSAKVKPPKMCSRCSRLGSSPHRVRRTSESMPSAPISTSCSAVVPSAKCSVTARSSCSMRSTCWLNRMHALGDRGEHPLVELGAEQPDEAAAVGRASRPRPACTSTRTLPWRLRNSACGRCAEVLGVHAERAQRLQRRRPQVEDVPGGPGLAVPLVDDDVVAGLERRRARRPCRRDRRRGRRRARGGRRGRGHGGTSAGDGENSSERYS